MKRCLCVVLVVGLLIAADTPKKESEARENLSEWIIGHWATTPLDSEDEGMVRIEMTFFKDGRVRWAMIPVDRTGKEEPSRGKGYRLTDSYKLHGHTITFRGDMRGKGTLIHRVRKAGRALIWTVKDESDGTVEETRFTRK